MSGPHRKSLAQLRRYANRPKPLPPPNATDRALAAEDWLADAKPRKKRKGTFRVPKTDFVGKHDAKTYAVGIDPSGKCNWETNMTDTEHVIEVLTEKVSGEYLDHLRSVQVSYIFAGATEIDLHVALRKLRSLFGIQRARIDGGGTVNGSFLKAGLIDELSHIIVPVADGSIIRNQSAQTRGGSLRTRC